MHNVKLNSNNTVESTCGCLFPDTSSMVQQARHTGIKIVQQIAILLGCAVLPHLKALVDIVKHGLTDENQKVKTITALTVAALAEAAAPYGIESFDDVLEPLWKGIRLLRGKVLAAFLKVGGISR